MICLIVLLMLAVRVPQCASMWDYQIWEGTWCGLFVDKVSPYFTVNLEVWPMVMKVAGLRCEGGLSISLAVLKSNVLDHRELFIGAITVHRFLVSLYAILVEGL
jgi:hypothetical protein